MLIAGHLIVLGCATAVAANTLMSAAPMSRSRASIRAELDNLGLKAHHSPEEIDMESKISGTVSYMKVANEFQLVNTQNMRERTEEEILASDLDSYVITLVTPLAIDNDDIVSVSYYSTNPQYSDWIGAYSPVIQPGDLQSTVPVKFGWCDRSETYRDSNSNEYGRGTLKFNMTNLRDDIVFYYFTGGTYHPVMVNNTLSTFTVSYNNINQPLRPRVVPTGDTDVFKLLWSSATSTEPTLKWGVESGKYKYVVEAGTSSIAQSSMCGPPANTTGWRDMGLIHTASLVGMAELANQKIYYSFGDDATSDYSSEHVFYPPPLPGTQPSSTGTRIILYDDLGRGTTDDTYTWNEYGRPSVYTIMAVGAEVATGEVAAVYHGGDISYATGYAAVWDFFLDMLSPVSASTLYLTTVGNHESDWPCTATTVGDTDSGGECGVTTTTHLPMPEPATTDKPWWSYDVGLIHMVGMSTEHNYSLDSEQYQWLEKDLASVDRTVSPWIVFGGHRAMYINSDYGGKSDSDITVMNNLIAVIEPLLWKYRVNVGFYGHNHAVQRHSAVLNKTVIQQSTARVDSDGKVTHWHVDPQATVHMVVGTGGASFTENAMFGSDKPVWNEMVMYEYGFARVTAVNATYLDWEWVNAYSQEVVDHMVITQPANPPLTWTIPTTSTSSSSDDDYASSTLGIFTIIMCICGFFVGAYWLYAFVYMPYLAKKAASTDSDTVGLNAAEDSSTSSNSSSPIHASASTSSIPLSIMSSETDTIRASEDSKV